MNNALVSLISKSRRSVTILFTDIVDSTHHWGHKGDIKGRLMIDQQNRLIFPVIRKYRGKVVKTIGDAVMASFTNREFAVRAAIGIQQVLAEHRKRDRSFTLKLRIGLHTGQALVEKSDVFGDTVNVASRIESIAEPDEILISSVTATRSHNKEYQIRRKSNFIPKGKSQSIGIYQVDWKNAPSLINDINFDSVIPVMARQKAELFVYLMVALGLFYFIFQKYLRYLLADQMNASLLTYSLQQLFSDHPYVMAAAGIGVILLALSLRFLLVMPILLLRILKGMFGYALIFFALHFTMPLIPEAYRFNADDVLYESENRFVEILSDNARLYADHDAHSEVVRKLNANEVYLQEAEYQNGITMWNKARVNNNTHGWVELVRPPGIGIIEERLSASYKFEIRYTDYIVLIFSLLGFIWGFFSFAVKPV